MQRVLVALALLLTACEKVPQPADASRTPDPVPAVPVATAPSSAPGDSLPVLKDQLYDQARAALKGQGYEPVIIPCTKDTVLCHGDLPLKYPEVMDCAGTGVQPCIFLWRQTGADRYIQVMTVGEEKMKVSGVEDITRAEIDTERESRAALGL